MIRSHRFALITAAVVFALSSCGDPNTAQPAAQKPKVIELANGGGAATTKSAAPTALGTADSKMAPFGPVDYVYDGDLPALDQPAPSWFFAADQQPDQQRIAKLAKSLGIDGEVRPVPAEQGGGWAVGPFDFSGPVLTVGTDGMLSWWYSPGSIAATGYACAEPGIAIDPNNGDGAGPVVTVVDVSAPGVVDAVIEPPVEGSGGGGVVGEDPAAPPEVAPPTTNVVAPLPTDCVPPTPPPGVPTKDEALTKAKELMASWGYDVASYQFDNTHADEWNATVSASLVLEGMKAPVTVSVGFGENGSITWASGSLAEPQRGADYPTVGAAKGLERLKDQPAMYGGPRMMAAGDVAASPAVGAPDVAPCESGLATDCAPISTEPVTVTMNTVKLDLTMVWDADNTVWLLPAYTFGSADGGTYTVMAVDDSFIKQPTPDVPVGEPTPLPAPVPGEAPSGEDPAAVPTT